MEKARRSQRSVSERIIPASELEPRYPSVAKLLNNGGRPEFPPPAGCFCGDDSYSEDNPRGFIQCLHDSDHFICLQTWCKGTATTCPHCRKDISAIAVLRVVPPEPRLTSPGIQLAVREARIRRKVQVWLPSDRERVIFGISTEAEQNVSYAMFHFVSKGWMNQTPFAIAGYLFCLQPRRSRRLLARMRRRM